MPFRHAIAHAVACALMVGGTSAWAGPVGEQVVAGQAGVTRSGSNTLIQQTTERAAINWQSFNIGVNESVRFAQPSVSSITLNRVLGQNASEILGSLSANGQIFLLNPNGVLFGRGAQVNVGGLVASTLGLGDSDFMAGRYRFASSSTATSGAGMASVVNQGEIVASSGYVALMAPQVRNEGAITAPGGAALAAGNQTTLNLNGNKLIGLTVDLGVIHALAENKGLIRANGGQVLLTAKAADQIIRSVVNNTGIIEATSIAAAGGLIRLEGDFIAQAGTLDASGTQGGSVALNARAIVDAGTADVRGHAGAGGRIDYSAAEGIVQTADARLDARGTASGGGIRLDSANTLFSSATLDARGQSGGSIDVLGQNIVLAAATLDASGVDRGGAIRIGGDFRGANPAVRNARNTIINGATRITADGGQGTVVVWSDETTGYYGTASALGGGAIEISSHGTLTYAGSANAGAGGTLLLDPANIIIDSASGPAAFSLIDPHAAAGNAFGANVTTLGSTVSGVFTSSGKVVIAVPADSLAATNAGAVYLFDTASGALVAALNGTLMGDMVGSGGVAALTNGNYVVASPNWSGGLGAATWSSGASGVTGVVSAGNSLVGAVTGDAVSSGGVSALVNGNFLVRSVNWNDNRGAVTWGNGAGGIAGTVSSGNSLVGTVAGDSVGGSGVTALSNGNYVVASPSWSNNTGAVTWGDGTSGVAGAVSAANSLVGTVAGDFVGGSGVTALSNGNYVVASAYWSNNTGAATWGDGTSGVAGAVSAANSLVGTTAGDLVSASGIRALANGNYVVASGYWNNNTGAATWGSGTSGVAGTVSIANSVVGTTPSDQVGNGGVVALVNGNYVVRSANWNSDAGAATWGSGVVGVTGTVSSANSLVGTTAGDRVSSGGVTALTNGNYVVSSGYWNNNAGAATWGSGASGVKGTVSAANSLVGSAAGDAISNGGITALSNGNYVVASANWNGDRGAVTWGNGVGGVTGAVTAGNSLVGTMAGDAVGSGGITTLTNGNYVVASSSWNGGTGAATWGDGASATTGEVSAANSLVGATAGDYVGSNGITALTNGNYVVASSYWNNGTGAATWGSGVTGVTGVVSAGNSLVGATVGDYVGSNGITALSNGSYAVRSADWNGGMGAVTWGSGASGVTGAVSIANSLAGVSAGDYVGGSGVVSLVNGNYLVQSAGYAANAGAVQVGTPGDISFANGTGQTMTFNPSSLSATLASGTAVSLQASNDITVNASVIVAGANGGAFTLQAGRHINLNANIVTANGNFTAIAGDAGAVTADRLAGTPTITLGNDASINAGTGVVNLVAIGGNFVNNSGSTTPIAAGRWLVWSTDPANDTRGGMPHDFKQYNAAFGVTAPVQGTGNGFLYTLAPTVTPMLTGTVSKVYDATTAATLAAGNYAVSGAVDGDVVTLNNLSMGNYDDKNAGTSKNVSVSGISITGASNGTATVYGYQLGSTTANANIGEITPATLNVTYTGVNKVYDATTTATVTTSDNRLGADILTINRTANFSDANVGANKSVDVTSVSLSGVDAGNYTVSATGGAIADITDGNE